MIEYAVSLSLPAAIMVLALATLSGAFVGWCVGRRR